LPRRSSVAARTEVEGREVDPGSLFDECTTT